MMNNAVTAPALSSTSTCAPIELDRARVGVRASRFAAHHGAQHVSRCIMTPDICPSTASVQPSTLDSGEASIYVQYGARRDEYVVYSAHLDHLGLCPPADGDPVCHGAFDNASGVAVLLELARAYARMKPAPRRSVVFLFVTGEEQAAFAGSDYFAEKPTVPRDGIVANINVDGAIGIFGDTKDIVARGAEHSTLDVNVRAAAGRIGYAINPDPTPEEVLFIRSDQYSFVRRGIPALYVTEGSQAADPEVDQLARAREWLATRYHTTRQHGAADRLRGDRERRAVPATPRLRRRATRRATRVEPRRLLRRAVR